MKCSFDLTEQEIELSKTYYKGKVIKCIIAPYHSYEQLKDMVDYSTILFPERGLSLLEADSFIYNLIENDEVQEATIITSNPYIVRDMIRPCVRVFTFYGELARFPMSTFRINLLELEEILFTNEDEEYRKEDEEPKEFKAPPAGHSYSDKIIVELIDFMNEYSDGEKTMSKKDFDSVQDKIKMIGDTYLRVSLEMHGEKITVES